MEARLDANGRIHLHDVLQSTEMDLVDNNRRTLLIRPMPARTLRSLCGSTS